MKMFSCSDASVLMTFVTCPLVRGSWASVLRLDVFFSFDGVGLFLRDFVAEVERFAIVYVVV